MWIIYSVLLGTSLIKGRNLLGSFRRIEGAGHNARYNGVVREIDRFGELRGFWRRFWQSKVHTCALDCQLTSATKPTAFVMSARNNLLRFGVLEPASCVDVPAPIAVITRYLGTRCVCVAVAVFVAVFVAVGLCVGRCH